MTITQPQYIPRPFGVSASTTTTIPDTTATPGAASWTAGFPDLTMTPIGSGGVPPRGRDFNGLLKAHGEHIVWQQAGGQYGFNPSIVSGHGGYNQKAILQSSDGRSLYVSLVANNTADFNANPSSIGTNWLPIAGDAINQIVAVATTGGTVILTAQQMAAKYINITGALTSTLNIVYPNTASAKGQWILANDTTGAFACNVAYTGGTSIQIRQGSSATVIRYGNNIVFDTPDAVLQAPGTNNATIANTAFVQARAAVTEGLISNLPLGQNMYYQPGQLLAARHYARITSATTLVSQTQYNSDTTGGGFTVLLPSSPINGDYVMLNDVGLAWLVSPMIVNGNGKLIEGDADLSCNIEGISFALQFSATENEWKIVMTQNLSAVLANIGTGTGAITTSRVMAGESIASGDVVSVRGGGSFMHYAALDPAAVGAKLRPLFEATLTGTSWPLLDAVQSYTYKTGEVITTVGINSFVPRTCQLTNGNIILAWCGTNNNVYFLLCGMDGRIFSPTAVLTRPVAATGQPFDLCAITGGGFVIAFVNPSFGVEHVVYNASGGAGAVNTFDSPTLAIGTVNTLHLCPLSTGGYAMMCNMASGAKFAPKFGIFNSTGGVVLAPVQIAAPAVGGTAYNPVLASKCAQLSGGNIAVGCVVDDGTGTTGTVKVAVYSTAGVQQGGTFSGASVALSTASHVAFAASSNKSIYFVSNGSSTVLPYTIASTGAVTITNYSTGGANPVLMSNSVQLSSTAVAIAWRGGTTVTGVNAAYFADTGLVSSQLTDGSMDTTAGAQQTLPWIIKTSGTGIALYTPKGGTPQGQVTYWQASGASIVTAGIAAFAVTGASSTSTRIIENTASLKPTWANLFCVIDWTSNVSFRAFCIEERNTFSPVGVATAAATSGDAIQLQVSGSQTTNGMWYSRWIDSRTAALSGIKIYLTGNRAIMGTDTTPKLTQGLLTTMVGVSAVNYTPPVDVMLSICYSNIPSNVNSSFTINGNTVLSFTPSSSQPNFTAQHIVPLRAGVLHQLATSGFIAVTLNATQI